MHSRIIPLSLHPIFRILAPRPLSSRLGAFLSPETFPRKNFRKIFYINQSFGANFFLLLWREKLWGLNTLFAPRMGGGIPFCMLPGCSLASPFLLHLWQIFRQSGQNRAKVRFYLVCFGVFSGFWETKNGKSKYIFGFEGLQGLPVWLCIWGGGGVHWVQVVRLSGLPVSCGVCSVLLSLCRLSFRFLSCISLGICLISRFKGILTGFLLLYVGLYCLRALRGLWGFCVREWLGGLKARGVFAFLLSFFLLL